jgi:hypothetical protein
MGARSESKRMRRGYPQPPLQPPVFPAQAVIEFDCS